MSQLWWKKPRAARLKETLCREVDWKPLYEVLFGWKEGENLSCFKAEQAEEHEFSKDSRPSLGVLKNSPGAVNCFTCDFKASSFLGVLEAYHDKPYDEVCEWAYRKFVQRTISHTTLKSLQKLLARDDLLLKVQQKLKISKLAIEEFGLGWSNKRQRLTIPIFNEFGYCVDVRCYDIFRDNLARDPNAAKVISWKKGFGASRLFPFLAMETVVLVEGEKDMLAAQSIGLPAQTMTGAAKTILEPEEAKRQFEGKTVRVVTDNDGAGKPGAKNRIARIKEVGGAAAQVFLPVKEPKEDMCDWVFKYGGTSEQFWELTQALTTQGLMVAPNENPTPIDADVSHLFASKSKASADVAVAMDVFTELQRSGWFYKHDGALYFATDRDCVRVHKTDSMFRSMMARMDPHINKETPTGKVVLEHVENLGWPEAVAVNVGNQSFYSLRDNSLFYRSSKDSQHIHQIKPGKTEDVKNGKNDSNVLLVLNDEAFQSITVEGNEDWKVAIKWCWSELFKFIPTSDFQRVMVFAWFLAGFFKQMTPDRPILRFLAPSAHGKSHALRMLSMLIYGSEYIDGPNTTVASMSTNAVKRPVLFVDNIEMEHVIKREGLNDLFISLATNVAKEKRRSGTDTGVVYERPDCITATTGIEPFDRHEIINRFIYATIDRSKYGRDDYFDFLRFDKIAKGRSKALAGLYKACELVLKELPAATEARAKRLARSGGFIRYPVYMALMEAWVNMICEVCEVKSDNGQRLVAKEVMDQIINLQAEQMDIHNEGTNPVLTWLDTLWERTCGSEPTFLDGAHRPTIDSEAQTCEWFMAPTELLNELSVLARTLGRRIPWHNAHQLSCRVTDAKHLLKRAGWTVKRVKSGGKNYYHFLKDSLPLGSVQIKAAHKKGRKPKGRRSGKP